MMIKISIDLGVIITGSIIRTHEIASSRDTTPQFRNKLSRLLCIKAVILIHLGSLLLSSHPSSFSLLDQKMVYSLELQHSLRKLHMPKTT